MDDRNQSAIIGLSAVLVGIIVIAGFFVLRSLVNGGQTSTSGESAEEAEAAVAAAEQEASGVTAMAESSTGQGQQPFDENSLQFRQPAPARFEEADDEFEDVEDYSNDQSDTSTLTEDDMSNTEIV